MRADARERNNLQRMATLMKFLGNGVYTLSEVTKLTAAPPRTVRDWFKWRSDKKGNGPIFTSDYEPVGEDYAVSFLNLIDVYLAGFFLKSGVKAPVIRKAYSLLQHELHTPHPFAHADLSTDGSAVIQETIRREQGDRFIDVITKQTLFPEFKMRLTRLRYSDATKLANSWEIADRILVNPRVGFGKPVVEKTCISTAVLADAFRANGQDAKLVAKIYKIGELDVVAAVRFEDNIARKVA